MKPKPVNLTKATIAFLKQEAHHVTLIQMQDRQWMITFLMKQKEGHEALCTLLTQRGEIRTWAHTDRLFTFIQERFKVETGEFKLQAAPFVKK